MKRVFRNFDYGFGLCINVIGWIQSCFHFVAFSVAKSVSYVSSYCLLIDELFRRGVCWFCLSVVFDCIRGRGFFQALKTPSLLLFVT